MIIDLHIHSKTCSDGKLTVQEIIKEAKARNIGLMSISDHDSIGCQQEAMDLAKKHGINYVSGVELNITFSCPDFLDGKSVSLDLLGYNFDVNNKALLSKLKQLSDYREKRAIKILEKLNAEFEKEGISKFTKNDLVQIQNSAAGALGRPHIADYLIKKGIVKDRKEAFLTYLVKCNVPKYPLYAQEASKLLRDAGGFAVLAHPNDPYGTSMVKITSSLDEQTSIIKNSLLKHLDGIECWHSRSSPETTKHYVKFAKQNGLKMTGGSDCHQNPIIMGTVKVPDFVAKQFV
ncbi:MAG: PHP domain-containing protein [Candidatus Bathyarchaeum tardum]|nr:MAG: PHP domain-containing protein [Candidatus Bathyarchaeum tardum]